MLSNKELFNLTFKVDPEEIRLSLLIEKIGEPTYRNIIEYLSVVGLRPVQEGKNFNPYGLIWQMAKNWIIK